MGWIRAATGTLPLAESATYVIAPELETHSLEGLALMLLLARSFSAGLVAFSGVSTISNSVKYFRRPKKYNAAVTMMLMVPDHLGPAGEPARFCGGNPRSHGARYDPFLVH